MERRMLIFQAFDFVVQIRSGLFQVLNRAALVSGTPDVFLDIAQRKAHMLRDVYALNTPAAFALGRAAVVVLRMVNLVAHFGTR